MLTDVTLSFVLADVRRIGVRVAINEFGIGHTSIVHLGRLAVEVVKLDRSFLENFGGDTRGRSFVAAVVASAYAGGMRVVVDGIETQAQFDMTLGAAADMVQGFLLARPMPAAEAAELAAGP